MDYMKRYDNKTTATTPEKDSTASSSNVKFKQESTSKKGTGQDQISRSLNSIPPLMETTSGNHLQRQPIAVSFAGNQSNPAKQQAHNSQSEKMYYPSLPAQVPPKPVTSETSRVVAQSQNRSDFNSAMNTTNTYDYYMPPPPRDQKALPSAHAQHTGPVYQSLPLARSAVDDKSARVFSAHESLPSHPQQNALPSATISASTTQQSTNFAGHKKEESGALTKNKETVAPKAPESSSKNPEKNPNNTEKERTEKILNGKESIVSKQHDNKMTDQEWKKEKEQLLARKVAQEEYIQKLSERPPVRPSAQSSLQERKLRLEKQVR